MQNGSVVRRTRKMHSDIWQFRWREKTTEGKKIYRRTQIGTIDQIPDIETARKIASLLVPDLNARLAKSKSVSMTIAQLCSHFEQSELCPANTWRSYSTKNIYKVYLKRWIIPKWSEHLLSDIRTIEVESWLRSLPIARSTCAKIRNVMSVLFNHACRYEFFDGNPIRLVRQSAKRRSPPVVLTPGEIRILLEGLKDSRENSGLHRGINWHSAKRTVRSEMGRYQSFCRNNERGAFHRPRFRGTVQNGILSEASTDPSPGLRSARQVERTVPLSPARRLGFCEPA